MAYTKPQQRKKEEGKRLKGERDRIKFSDLRFDRGQVVSFNASVLPTGIAISVGMLQKSVLLGTARILRKVFDVKNESILLAHGLLVVTRP